MLIHSSGKFGKLISIIAVVMMTFTALSACAQQSSSTNTQSQQPIVIGASVANAGDFSADGQPTAHGYQLWANEINKQGGLLGRQVRLDLVNDNSTPEGVTTAYQKLINVDHVNLVVGPFADLTSVAAAKVASRSGYALIEGSGTANAVFQQGLNNIFSVSLSAKNYLVSFANFVLSLPASMRPKTAAYATEDDPFLVPQIDSARALLEQGGVQTVLNDQYPAETSDYTPYAQKVIASRADLVVLGTFTPDSIAYVKAFKQQHYNPKVMLEASGPDQGDQFTGPIGGANVAEGVFVPNGGWFPDINTFQNTQFQNGYIAKYGGTKDSISSDTVQAYSVMQVLEQAVNKIHSIDNAKLQQELHSDSFNTLQGPVKFAADGQNTTAVAFLFQWQKGHLVPVYPQNNAQANPEYPKAQWPS
jgi:branched-chain amino acid transport system substrate-binding protein